MSAPIRTTNSLSTCCMNELPDQLQDAATLKWLKILVVVLSCTFIAGFILVCVLFVIRFSDFGRPPPAMALPAEIELPSGVTATAFTQGTDWYAVVTEADEILIFDVDTGRLKRRIRLTE